MAHAGQEIEGPDGFRLRLVRTAAETGGELLEMEARYPGTTGLPPEHRHPLQDERFEVLEGSVRAIIGGVERRFEPGDTFEVPRESPHQVTGDGPARVRWEVRPALRTAEFFERIYSGAAASGSLTAFLTEFSDEIRITGLDPGEAA